MPLNKTEADYLKKLIRSIDKRSIQYGSEKQKAEGSEMATVAGRMSLLTLKEADLYIDTITKEN